MERKATISVPAIVEGRRPRSEVIVFSNPHRQLLDTFRLLLAMHGYTNVTFGTTFQETIDVIDKLRPDLFITNWGLQGATMCCATEVARRVRGDSRLAHTRIILSTGFWGVRPADAEVFDVYLKAPYHPETLIDCIDAQLDDPARPRRPD